jgi:hypothetical protein
MRALNLFSAAGIYLRRPFLDLIKNDTFRLQSDKEGSFRVQQKMRLLHWVQGEVVVRFA